MPNGANALLWKCQQSSHSPLTHFCVYVTTGPYIPSPLSHMQWVAVSNSQFHVDCSRHLSISRHTSATTPPLSWGGFMVTEQLAVLLIFPTGMTTQPILSNCLWLHNWSLRPTGLSVGHTHSVALPNFMEVIIWPLGTQAGIPVAGPSTTLNVTWPAWRYWKQLILLTFFPPESWD